MSVTINPFTGEMQITSSGGGGGTDANSFAIFQPDSGTSPTANSVSDTLTITSSDASISNTGDATAKSIDLKLSSTLQTTISSNTTAIAAKAPTASPTFTGTVTAPTLKVSGLTASTVPYLDSSKNFASSAVTPTALGYIANLSSDAQTQITTNATAITGKVSKTGDTMSGPLVVTNSSAGTTGTPTKVVTGDANTSGLVVKATTNPAATPAGTTFYASFATSTTADTAAGTAAASANLNASVSGAKLQLNNTGSGAWIRYSSASNAPLNSAFTIQFKLAPYWTGTPSPFTQKVFSVGLAAGTVNSAFEFQIATNGDITLTSFSSGGSTVSTITCGNWSTAVSGTEAEFEIDWDGTTVYVYRDGTRIGTGTFTIATGYDSFFMGRYPDGIGSTEFAVRDLIIINSCKHTASTYTAPTNYGTQVQLANLQEWQDASGTVLASIDASGNVTSPTLTTNASNITTLQNYFDPTKYSIYFDDFTSTATAGPPGWALSSTGTGATSVQSNVIITNARRGIWALSPGTTSTGTTSMRQYTGSMVLGGGAFSMQTSVQLSALSTSTDEYVFRWGLGTNITQGADEAQGVWFEYDRLGQSVNWVMATADNSARTRTASSTAVAASAWVKLRIDVNAAGTLATFFVNGASVGTISTNIPITSSRACGEKFHMYGTTYTSVQKFAYLDYHWSQLVFTSAR